MWTLLADPLGRALLSLLTTDHGLPGDPQRKVLLRELQALRTRADAQCAPDQVRRAIRSALLALRSEFPNADPGVPAISSAAVIASDAVSPTAR
jgi:hypothetical protein